VAGEGPTELRLHVTIPLPSVLLPARAKSSLVRPNVSTRSAPDLSDSDVCPVRRELGRLKIVPRTHSAPSHRATPGRHALSGAPTGRPLWGSGTI